MKLAWLVWDNGATIYPEIRFNEPEEWTYHRIVPIVYAEIKE